MNRTKYIRYLYLLPLILTLVLFIVQASFLNYSDYAGYYFGSIGLIHRNFQEVYDTYLLNQNIVDQGYKNIFVSYTPFPPFTSILFAPFTLFPVYFSKIVFNIFSSFLFLFTLYRCIKHLSIHSGILLFIPIIFFIPLRNNICFGQSYLLLFVLLMEGYLAYKNNKDAFASIWWGIAIVFKIFPALIIVYLLVKKEYKKVLYLTIACLFFVSVSLLINGFDSWKYYLTTVFPRLNNGELNNSFTYLFQSFFMLLKNLFIHDELMNADPIYHSPLLFSILLVLFKGLLITTAILITKKDHTSGFLSFAFWILASILISPNGSTYSLILLLIVFMAVLTSDFSFTWKIVISILLLLICTIPVHYFADFNALLKFPRLYLLLALFMVIVVKMKIYFNYKLAGLFIMLFALMESVKLLKNEDKSFYLLAEEKHILIHDYSIRNNKLVYHYWSEEGSKEEETQYSISEWTAGDLTVKDNQIFQNGKRITNSPDRKKKPVLANGKEIIYLSDKNRGVGFYTLRKIGL